MEKLQIGPVEIRHQEFSSALRGYKKDEVDEFLEIVASQMEDLLFSKNKQIPQTETKKDKIKVEEKQEVFTDEIELPPKKIEKPNLVREISNDDKAQELLISKTLMLAEQMRERIVDEAKKKAEKLLQEAHNEAESLIRDAQNSLTNLVQEYYEIKDMKKTYLKNIRTDLQVIIDRIDQKSLLKNELENELDDRFKFFYDQLGSGTEND